MDRKFLTSKHPLWHANIQNWEFYIRSYLGGNDYKNGYYLGEVKAFKRHGYGKYYFNSGSIYDGF